MVDERNKKLSWSEDALSFEFIGREQDFTPTATGGSRGGELKTWMVRMLLTMVLYVYRAVVVVVEFEV